jgi:hypothetical protein
VSALAREALRTKARRRAALLALVLAAAASFAADRLVAAPSKTISANWSGYAVTGTQFTSVEAEWVQPAAVCPSGAPGPTAASFWVGLGGNSPISKTSKVEQIGTDSDCGHDGRSSYYAWYELWPADSVDLRLHVSPGDTLWASVEIRGSHVVLRLRNLSTGAAVTRSLALTAPDTSSAEWIAEAPSIPVKGGSERAALTDFGRVRFAGARATSASGRAGSITTAAWHASAIGLSSAQAGRHDGPDQATTAQAGDARGIPSALNAGGTAFSITWHGSAAGRP